MGQRAGTKSRQVCLVMNKLVHPGVHEDDPLLDVTEAQLTRSQSTIVHLHPAKVQEQLEPKSRGLPLEFRTSEKEVRRQVLPVPGAPGDHSFCIDAVADVPKSHVRLTPQHLFNPSLLLFVGPKRS